MSPSLLQSVQFSSQLRVALLATVVLALFAAGPAGAQQTLHLDGVRTPTAVADRYAQFQKPPAESAVAAAPWQLKLDGAARLLATSQTVLGKRAADRAPIAHLPVRLGVDPLGASYVDVFIRLRAPGDASRLDALGVERRTQVDDVVLARAPLHALQALGEATYVRFVETSKERQRTNDAGRTEIRADEVHEGIGLSQAYRGEGVVVGVLDSGLDVTHPDFGNAAGTRVQYLLEYTQDGGQQVWSKADIDADPAAVTQRDGNGGGGHGTHVTGTAAGGGRADATYTGVAPAADIVFVKGVREPDSNGGFADADVVDGSQFIFEKAAELGKPAVINLSLGGNYGPLDGTSLYEQTLSGLTGPGRIIVAAAGNEGADFIHAGETVQPNVVNQTILLANNPQFARAEMWYEPGTVSRVAVGMYGINEQNEIVSLGQTDPVDVGQVLGVDASGNFAPVPLQVDGQTHGYLYLDAATTQDQRNGDGSVLFFITSNDDPEVDVSQTIWSLLFVGNGSGRVDLWAGGGNFLGRELGFEDVDEVPGDNASSMGSPATARSVISVGSYTTKNAWTDVDGTDRQLQVPDATGEGRVVPTLGDVSYFSSRGPTRDGRVGPDIAAPGERIASALSSHLQEGQGVRRPDIVQGGRYQVMEGTSMASPHIAGVVALMLQADPTLDYARAVQILTETARGDAQTGTLPNNSFGAGRVDAWAAVKRAADEAGSGGGAAVADLNVDDVEVAVRPDGAAETAFELRNTGAATLSYTITPSRTLDRQEVRGGVSSFMVASPAGRGVMRLAEGRARTGRSPGSITATAGASTAGPAAQDMFVLDDGDDMPDTFLGFDDGVTDFYWANQFDLAGTAFQLEEVAFYMRTGTATFNPVWVGVYDAQLQAVASGTIEQSLSPEGSWYAVELDVPIQFSDGETFYIEIGTSGVIDYAAGTDTLATVAGKSFYFDSDAVQYASLSTVPGFENGAFLVRAVGTVPDVPNQAPNAVARVSTVEARVDEVVTFDASSSSDTDGQIVGYQWEFGDGATSTGPFAEHAYSQAGTYTARLTVTDDGGATGQTSAQVAITDAPVRLTVLPASGTVAPGGTQVVTVHIDAAGLGEGSYDGQVAISSNGGNFSLPVRVVVDQSVDAEEDGVLPTSVQLDQNYPNPFQRETAIRYVLTTAAHVSLEVYDVYGRRVAVLARAQQPPGAHIVHWNGRDAGGHALASGFYVYRLHIEADDGQAAVLSNKMVLVK